MKTETALGELELAQAAVTYPGAVPVRALRPLSLRIAPGEMIAIVGRSGSGKSTLLNVLGLLDRPTAGRYLIRGVDTTTLSESAITTLRGRQFGFVFQAYHLLADRTAAENAELGLLYQRVPRRTRRARAIAALKRVGLAHRLDAMPGTLSGGERQRVAIARALAQRPRVLLCDEPTGNLDRVNADLIMEMLTALNADGLTVVIVTHDAHIADRLPRRLHIDDGAVTDSTVTDSTVTDSTVTDSAASDSAASGHTATDSTVTDSAASDSAASGHTATDRTVSVNGPGQGTLPGGRQ